MAAEEYKEEYARIAAERRPEDLILKTVGLTVHGVLISHDHEHNMRCECPIKFCKDYPDKYRRELAFQKALYLINEKRCSTCTFYVVGDIVKIRNGWKGADGKDNLYFEDWSADNILGAEIECGPNVTTEGIIYYQAHVKRENYKYSEVHMGIHPEQIIL